MTRDEAIDLLGNLVGMVEDNHESDYDCALKMAIEALSAKKQGEWVYLYDGNYKCSECCAWYSCEGEPIEQEMSFCPNCGADMRGEQNE